MAKNKQSLALPLYGVIVICFILLVITAFMLHRFQPKRVQHTAAVSPTISPETSVLIDVAVWYPSAPWSEPKPATQTTFYGTLGGESISATVTQPNPTLPHFEIVSMLGQMGFQPDNNLAADGPGSSVWGYMKEVNGKKQVLTFSYRTKPSNTNPNEPVQFNCPCTVDVTAFVSNPF